MIHETIIVLDFGGQYTHLIASRIRRLHILALILNPEDATLEKINQPHIKGIILSGGPQSVYDPQAPKCDPEIFQLGKPILGICYGHQYLCQTLGASVKAGTSQEFGRAELSFDPNCPLFHGLSKPQTQVWMSHGDSVQNLPEGFITVGKTKDCNPAAVYHAEKNILGIQFHPEVTHSEDGAHMIKNFVQDICKTKDDWRMADFFQDYAKSLKAQVGDQTVFLFVSGGVDSTVAFAFLSQILGKEKVKGLFVDTGLLRQGEVDFVERELKNIGAELSVLREGAYFLEQLKGVYDPEKKREIIGNAFLEVQRRFFAKNKISEGTFLAQGTIYPDTIETGCTKNAAKIKTHHNRVPEVQALIDAGKIIEPLADLYKDEVRVLGEHLKLPHRLVWRHPFPGPGLGVRILCNEFETKQTLETKNYKALHYKVLPIKSVGVQGDFRTYKNPAILEKKGRLDIPELEKTATALINQDSQINRVMVSLRNNFTTLQNVSIPQTAISLNRVERLQKADHIITMALQDMDLYEKVWQFPVILVPLNFGSTEGESIVLRPIDSIDVMSASIPDLPQEFFDRVVSEILEIPQISNVFLDITSKPPGTIEWE